MRCNFLIGLVIGLIAPPSWTRAQDAISPPIHVEEPPPIAPSVPAPNLPMPSEVERAEAEAARAVVAERLRVLELSAEQGRGRDEAAEARIAAIRDLLKSREQLLVDWEKVAKARSATERPAVTPESEAAALKSVLDRAKAALVEAARDPKSLLPEAFRDSTSPTTEASLAEMKEAVAAAQDAVEDLKKSAHVLSKGKAPLAAAKAERDEVRKRIAAVAGRAAEAEAALASGASPGDREIGRERIINLDWEGRVEAERLKEIDARISLEARRAAVSEIKGQVEKLKLDLASLTSEALQAEYRRKVDRHQAELERASADEGVRAAQTGDPLVRYRARRMKEILDQQVRTDGDLRELAATPEVDEKDQTEKAEKAAEDFKHLKGLVENPRSSALVAQRLNNSFRRLAALRDSIVRNELARILAQLTRYENELTEVELEQLNDERGDRAMRENLLASLPASRKTEALKLFLELEARNDEVLEKRRRALASLSARADRTRLQVLRRLQILDDQHAFVRTHLFWVRDGQPMGLTTVEQVRREGRTLFRHILAIVSESSSPAKWGRISSEFAAVAVALAVMPYLLYRLRRRLRVAIDHEPAPAPTRG